MRSSKSQPARIAGSNAAKLSKDQLDAGKPGDSSKRRLKCFGTSAEFAGRNDARHFGADAKAECRTGQNRSIVVPVLFANKGRLSRDVSILDVIRHIAGFSRSIEEPKSLEPQVTVAFNMPLVQRNLDKFLERHRIDHTKQLQPTVA